jgi:hypothetical protein
LITIISFIINHNNNNNTNNVAGAAITTRGSRARPHSARPAEDTQFPALL